MGLRRFVERITKPVEELDRERLAEFCEGLGVTPLDRLPQRRPVRFAGEVSAVRVVPRAGAPALEVTVRDGHGAITLVFLGRDRIGGLTTGRRLVAEGVVTSHGPDRLVYNPWYRLLPR